MYVAITRARRRLYLTFAQSRMLHGQTHYGMVSSFLRELPEELLHWITPRIAPRSGHAQSFASPYLTQKAPSDYAAPSARPAAESGWRIGQNVEHAKFGEGVVLNVEGSGADARVQVQFRKAGSKWLSLEYAKLTAV